MRLTLYTDYSLRVLLYLGIKGKDRLSTRNSGHLSYYEESFNESNL